jgi:hypothetical protein
MTEADPPVANTSSAASLSTFGHEQMVGATLLDMVLNLPILVPLRRETIDIVDHNELAE